MMKKFFTYTYLALSALVLFSCKRELDEYQKAAVEGEQVYFYNVPSNVDLTDNAGSFTVPVLRDASDEPLTVSLDVTADALFTVPETVSFEPGATSAQISIRFSPSDIVPDKKYPFTIALKDNISPYASSTCNFTAGIITPVAWKKMGEGTFTHAKVWDEKYVVRTALYYLEEEPGVLRCYLEPFFDQTIAHEEYFEPVGDPVKYEFYWYYDPKAIEDDENAHGPEDIPGVLVVPAQSSGYSEDGTLMFFMDVLSYFNTWYGADYWAESPKYEDWEDYCEVNGEKRAYYDGNGGFYLADYFMCDPESDYGQEGYGYGFGGKFDEFILDGFIRTTDYNSAKYFGASSALYEGNVSSMMLSADGTTALEFPASLRYASDYSYDPDAEYEEAPTTTYYIADYFAPGKCLAFVAPIPELLVDGSPVKAGDNDQFTGLNIFGKDIYTEIKKGSVSLSESSEFPVFNLTLRSYTKDVEGAIDIDFGQFTDTYTASDYGKDGYTLDDISGAEKDYYIGTWAVTGYDVAEGENYDYEIEIADAGTEGEGEDATELLTISNLSSYGDYFDDTIKAVWDSQYGVISIAPQTLEGTYSDENVVLTTYDPDSEIDYDDAGAVVWGGITEDDVLAFVSPFENTNLCGFAFSFSQGTLCIMHSVYGTYLENGSEAAPLQSRPAPKILSVQKKHAIRSINTSQMQQLTRISHANGGRKLGNLQKFF